MLSLPADAWCVVQVAPQSEKSVGSILEYKGYQLFAPTYLSRTQWSDRIKILERPLFPGYVFVRMPETTVEGLVCSTPGVVRILSFGGRPSTVPDSEIDAIRKFTLLGQPLPARHFMVGQKVEIRDGPFAGIIGIVKQVKDRACLFISVQLISQSIYIDVDERKVSPIASTSLDTYCHR